MLLATKNQVEMDYTKQEQLDWVVDFEHKLGEMETFKVGNDWKKRSIYKVPTCTKYLHKRAYIPLAVSFGPYHCKEEELNMPMEPHKHRALHHFLKRSNKPLKTYVEALQEVVQELMDSYDSLDVDNWQQNTFLQLMLLDGCFMLEILRANDVIRKPEDTYGDYGGVDDPIFSYHGKVYVMPHMKRDMLMLQNQLPMLLLKKLVMVEATVVEDPVNYLNKMILRFVVGPHYKLPLDSLHTDSLHVLDLYRKSLLGLKPGNQPGPKPGNRPGPKLGPRPTQRQFKFNCFDTKDEDESAEDIIRSAEKLNEAGVEFKRSDTTNLMDISFHSGTLWLPTIVVDDTTESAFLNLMTFERLHVGAGNEVTSFVSFMDNIVDSAGDVRLLHSSGIIHNGIGSEKAVANLFNGISQDATPDPEGILQKVHNDLNYYCKRKWNQHRANLKHTYFKSPWALASLLAAIFLMILTTAQTIYAIIAYHKPSE